MKTSNKILIVYIVGAVTLSLISLQVNLHKLKQTEPGTKLFFQKLASTQIRVVKIEKGDSAYIRKGDETWIWLEYTPTPGEIRGDTLVICEGIIPRSDTIILPHIETVVKEGKTIPVTPQQKMY